MVCSWFDSIIMHIIITPISSRYYLVSLLSAPDYKYCIANKRLNDKDTIALSKKQSLVNC